MCGSAEDRLDVWMILVIFIIWTILVVFCVMLSIPIPSPRLPLRPMNLAIKASKMSALSWVVMSMCKMRILETVVNANYTQHAVNSKMVFWIQCKGLPFRANHLNWISKSSTRPTSPFPWSLIFRCFIFFSSVRTIITCAACKLLW